MVDLKAAQNEYKELRKDYDSLYHAIDKINDLHSARVLSDKEHKKIIKILQTKYDMYKRQTKVVKDIIEQEQSKCTHKYPDGKDALVYEGHDSHKDFYVCAICGHEVWI